MAGLTTTPIIAIFTRCLRTPRSMPSAKTRQTQAPSPGVFMKASVRVNLPWANPSAPPSPRRLNRSEAAWTGFGIHVWRNWECAEPHFLDESGGGLYHGKARVCIQPVLGWLRRPSTIYATPRALSSLHRARARPVGPCVRQPHLRGNALLGRRLSRLGRGRTRIRGSVAEPSEVGCFALVEVGRAQRHASRG